LRSSGGFHGTAAHHVAAGRGTHRSSGRFPERHRGWSYEDLDRVDRQQAAARIEPMRADVDAAFRECYRWQARMEKEGGAFGSDGLGLSGEDGGVIRL
jgi:hypothetical protein